MSYSEASSYKRAYIAFEKFETYEYDPKRFEQVCREILDGMTNIEIDTHLHRIDPTMYKTLSNDHPFRKIVSRANESVDLY